MSFYFGKESGNQRKIRRDNGVASGALLTSLVKDTFLPISVSLEILSSIADILHEAKNLDSPHGNIQITDICISNDCHVYVNGFEQRNIAFSQNTTQYEQMQYEDIYGLGIIMLALLGQDPNFSPPDRQYSQDDYNMIIVEKLISIDWQELKNQPWLPQIQEFLISMLQIEEQARPSALDVTNVLAEVCNQCTGPNLTEFVQKNPEFFISLSYDYEELLSASAITAPIVEPLSFVPESSTGAATGLWPKEKIRELIQEDWSEEEDIQPRKNANYFSNISDDFSLPGIQANPLHQSQENLVAPQKTSRNKRDDSLRVVKTAFAPPDMNENSMYEGMQQNNPLPPSWDQSQETPNVQAQPYESLIESWDNKKPPVQDLTPTQSVPPITNIPLPNQQDTPYPQVISSNIPIHSQNPSEADPSLIQKITQHPQFIWFAIGGGVISVMGIVIIIVLAIVIQREYSNHVEPTTENTIETIEDPYEKEQNRIQKYHDISKDTGQKDQTENNITATQNEASEEIEEVEEIKEVEEIEEVEEIKEVTPIKTKKETVPKTTSVTSKSKPTSQKSTKNSNQQKNAQSSQNKNTPQRNSQSSQDTTSPKPRTTQTILNGNKFDVLFKLPQLEGKMVCGDGQNVEFSQSISLSFSSSTVCRIEVDGAKGVFIANQKQIVECVDVGGRIQCS